MKHFDPWDYVWILKDVALLLVSLGTAAWAWFRTRHAYSWPSAHGTIMGSYVERGVDSLIRPWTAAFSYSYSVNGEYYSGFHRLAARSERRAEEKIAGLKNTMIVVRYAPNQPDLSKILKSDQPGGQLGN
jgi:hypothetical protein